MFLRKLSFFVYVFFLPTVVNSEEKNIPDELIHSLVLMQRSSALGDFLEYIDRDYAYSSCKKVFGVNDIAGGSLGEAFELGWNSRGKCDSSIFFTLWNLRKVKRITAYYFKKIEVGHRVYFKYESVTGEGRVFSAEVDWLSSPLYRNINFYDLSSEPRNVEYVKLNRLLYSDGAADCLRGFLNESEDYSAASMDYSIREQHQCFWVPINTAN